MYLYRLEMFTEAICLLIQFDSIVDCLLYRLQVSLSPAMAASHDDSV